MRRNMKPEYINKLRRMDVPNGYKFDLANYLYNPSYDYDYPSFIKKIEETKDKEIYIRVYYFKHYDGTGEYTAETFSRIKNGEAWQIVKDRSEVILERSNRFSISKLLTFCK